MTISSAERSYTYLKRRCERVHTDRNAKLNSIVKKMLPKLSAYTDKICTENKSLARMLYSRMANDSLCENDIFRAFICLQHFEGASSEEISISIEGLRSKIEVHEGGSGHSDFRQLGKKRLL